MAIVSQVVAQGQPAPGFPQIPLSGSLGNVTYYGLQSSSFTAQANGFYLVPTGGTVTLPTPKGAGSVIVLAIFGTGTTTLSGTISASGATLSSYIAVGDQTLILTDASTTRGWV